MFVQLLKLDVQHVPKEEYWSEFQDFGAWGSVWPCSGWAVVSAVSCSGSQKLNPEGFQMFSETTWREQILQELKTKLLCVS